MPLESISMYMYIYIYTIHTVSKRASPPLILADAKQRDSHIKCSVSRQNRGPNRFFRGRYGRRRIGRGEAPKAGDLGHLWPANGLPRRSIAIRMISTREAGRKENFRIIGDRGTREFLSLRITFTHQHDQEINSRNFRGIFCRIVGVMMFYWEE